ncbi:hypothetical protein EMCRGX_G025928 [Ephydatia muelleri]
MNDILHRALSSANVPSRLEPTGLDRADASEVCAAANQAEQTKIKKCSYITSHAYHSFTPVATGVCGPRSMSFLSDLGHRIANTTSDKSSLAYLMQRGIEQKEVDIKIHSDYNLIRPPRVSNGIEEVTNWGAEMNPRSLKEHLTCEVDGYFKKQHFLQDGFTVPARK